MTTQRTKKRFAALFLEGDAEFSATGLDSFTIVALAYLALPLVIFLVTWLRPLAALGFLSAVGISMYSQAHRFRKQWRHRPSNAAIAVIFATALSWAALGGGSHYVYANPDWLVRDSVLGDLTFSQWPPSYRFYEGGHYLLRSAIGFFLPVAAAGKLLGAALLPHLMFIWTTLGVTIFLLLLPLPTTRPISLVGGLAIIVAFSGMDVLGIFLVHGHYAVFPLRLEWWNEFAFRASFSYSSLTGQLIWAPNHALPMWICTALLYRHWKHPDVAVLLCLMLPLVPLSSPFALPGLAPFAMYAVVAYRLENDRFPSVPIAAIVAAMLVLALLARIQTIDVDSMIVTSTSSAVTAPITDPLAFLRNYLVFVLMEFALLGLVLFRLLRHSRGIFLIALAVLLVLPLITLGPSNDLLLRVSSPALVMLAILTMRVLTSYSHDWSGIHTAVALMLIVGAHTPFNEAARAVLWKAWQPDYTRSLIDVQQGYLPPHYIGRLTDPILSSLLRTPSPVPSSHQRR